MLRSINRQAIIRLCPLPYTIASPSKAVTSLLFKNLHHFHNSSVDLNQNELNLKKTVNNSIDDISESSSSDEKKSKRTTKNENIIDSNGDFNADLVKEQKFFSEIFNHVTRKTQLKEKNINNFLHELSGMKQDLENEEQEILTRENNSEFQIPRFETKLSNKCFEGNTGKSDPISMSTVPAKKSNNIASKSFLTCNTNADDNTKADRYTAVLGNIPENVDLPLTLTLDSTFSNTVIENDENNENKNTIDTSTLTLDDIFPDIALSSRYSIDAIKNLDLKINSKTLEALKNKIELEARLEKELLPYLDNLNKSIDTDADIIKLISKYLVYFRNYLQNENNNRQNIINQLKTKSIFEIVRENLEEGDGSNIAHIPQPYEITIPFVIKHLMTNSNYDFVPLQRKYGILSWIHHISKNYEKNITLYLSCCNTDFYNLLIDYTWRNYKEIRLVSELCEEMKFNGVPGDLYTLTVLDKIVREMRNEEQQYSEQKAMNDDYLSTELNVLWNKANGASVYRIERYSNALKASLV
ncbi:uncharacterized protein SCODWIG_02310 [Saccharomycodes ludwigii]|uniref:Mtf2-like C-terminal domain-containing protein n=1 Tax=Saccharomycodes ludwigii TaxID=36035 RepID=A0A376B7K8_9ASCO|nr:uncharacterized protein SCODWIG_02310 [Saccharomycodes ludwigii]